MATNESTEPTDVRTWKRRRQGLPVQLPSGNRALVRNPGMQEFLRLGFIPQPLLKIVREGISGKGLKEEDIGAEVGKAIQTEDDLEELLRLFDKVLCHVVVEPPVRLPEWTEEDARSGLCEADEVGNYIPLDRRDDELLYADDVDQDDKEFIFQFAVGGTRDLEMFRQGKTAMLGAVSPSEGVADTTE